MRRDKEDNRMNTDDDANIRDTNLPVGSNKSNIENTLPLSCDEKLEANWKKIKDLYRTSVEKYQNKTIMN